MRRLRSIALLVAPLLLAAPALWAQDDVAMTPIQVGGFSNEGSVTVGGRLDDVKGYTPMFLEMYDLTLGASLEDFSLFGEAMPGTNSFADSYSILLSGLGNNPFPTAQIQITKNNVYDFRVNWRESHYIWDQNNNVVLPIAGPANLSTGLTDNHDWDTERGFGGADLTLHATRRLRFLMQYYRTTDDGTLFTTRSLDFFDSPGFWGAFARGNAFLLDSPLHDQTNRYIGGVDYTYNSWSFHYKAGYQTFSETTNLSNVTSPEGGINGTIAPTTDPLTNFSEGTMRRLTTPVSELSALGKPLKKLEWRANYMYYRYSGPATLNESFNGTAPPSSGTIQEPYTVSEAMSATVLMPENVVSMGLTWHITDWWDLFADYRYSRSTSTANGIYESEFTETGSTSSPGAPENGTEDTIWRDGLSDFDLYTAFRPTNNLLIEPGVHLTRADDEALEDGVVQEPETLTTKTVWPEFSFWYQPSKKFSLRGDYRGFTNGASYTAITPHTQVGGHVVARYQPIPKLSLEDDVNVISSTLIDSSYQQNVRDNAFTITYSLDQRLSVFAGFSYGSFLAVGNVDYARGTPPLDETLRDQEVDRVWEGGIETKPIKRFGARFTINYVVSTGLGQIGNEPPAYGPLTWPMGTATVYYDVPKAGRLSLDLQRTYYSEQIVPANNFSADLLDIRWTRNF